MGKIVFVTVGTTKFDALVKAMDNLEVAQELSVKGYTQLIMQVSFLSVPCFTHVNLLIDFELERTPQSPRMSSSLLNPFL